jgi:hypothetical protein
MRDMIPFIAVSVGVWLAHYLSMRAYRLGQANLLHRRR